MFLYLALISLLSLSMPSSAAVFTVDTTSDLSLGNCNATPNDCSLRGAIAAANFAAGEDTIHFNIPMSDPGCTASTGVCRIVFTSFAGFPSVNGLLTIDGYTQPGATPNTIPAPGANNAQLKIEVTALEGLNAVAWFEPTSTRMTLRGLAVFAPSVAMVSSFRGSVVVQGCWFGVQANGQAATYATQVSPIDISSLGVNQVIIGGPNPADRNVLAGSGRDTQNQIVGGGVRLRTSAFPATLLFQGNLVGLAPDGLTPLPLRDAVSINIDAGLADNAEGRVLDNRFVRVARTFSGNALQFNPNGAMAQPLLVQGNVFGLAVDGTALGVAGKGIQISVGNGASVPNIKIGGLAQGEGNVFANVFDIPGAGRGTAIGWGFLPSDSRVEVVGNRMSNSQNLGIDLPGPVEARTLNDAGDSDTGANGLQNFPEVTAFAVAGTLNLSYRVDSSTAASAYPLRVDFYRANGDEGDQLIASDSYAAANAQTVKAAQLAIPNGINLSNDDVLVAVATDAQGRSSEFSFLPINLSIVGIEPSACTGNPSVFCDGFDPPPLRSVKVKVRATSSVFKPNGEVRVSDSRGASCVATLLPSSTPLTSEGDCILVNSGAPGSRTVTAVYQTLTGAFGSATGGNVTVSGNFSL
jgi:CSLREA domain-containing protein